MKQTSDIFANPTINDIARVAQVSLATVDRVLNERPGVREVTVKKVNKAIAELGYVRDTAAANLARGRVYHFTFILPATGNEFLSSLEAQIEELSLGLRHERTKLSFVRVAAFDPVELSQAIAGIDAQTVDGVAIFAPETPSVRDSIAQLKAKGLSVVSLVADVPSSERDNFIGVNNVAAGRTAAQLMGRFLGAFPGPLTGGGSGKILVISGSMQARDALERRLGFDQVMTAEFPALSVLASLEGRDDPDLIERLLPQVRAANPEIIGIYASTAGHEGLLRHLRGHKTMQKPVVIAHELTPMTRDALSSGLFDAVISQDTGHLVRSAVRIMRANRDGLPINPAQERIRIDVYLKENLPS
jgi:LacI family transcriptional regulator